MQLIAADGTVYNLERSETRIGRSRDNEISLNDPGMSRHHAVVRLSGGKPVLQDLGSTNGTFINGRRVHGQAVLYHGDRIELAGTDLWAQDEGMAALDSLPTEMMPPRVYGPPITAVPLGEAFDDPGQAGYSSAPTVRFDKPRQPADNRRALGIISIGLGLLATTAAVTGAMIPQAGFICISTAVILAISGLICGVLAVMKPRSRGIGVVGIATGIIGLIAIFTVVMLAISLYSTGNSPLP